MYVSVVGDVTTQHDVQHHQYAEDMQVKTQYL